MLIRLWTTGFDPERLSELQVFADDVSAPMFAQLPGCLGHLYATEGSQWITASFWRSETDIELAEASPRYQDVVAQIQRAGFLRGEPSMQVMKVTGWSPPDLSDR